MAQSIVDYLIKACWTANETAQLRPWRSGWGGGWGGPVWELGMHKVEVLV